MNARWALIGTGKIRTDQNVSTDDPKRKAHMLLPRRSRETVSVKAPIGELKRIRRNSGLRRTSEQSHA